MTEPNGHRALTDTESLHTVLQRIISDAKQHGHKSLDIATLEALLRAHPR